MNVSSFHFMSVGRRLEDSCTHLDPEHFYLEVVDSLRSAGRSDVLRLRGHTDVNGDLEVILLLADEGLVGCRVDEAFICVDVVGGRRPGSTEGAGDRCNCLKVQIADSAGSVLTVPGSCRCTKCSSVPACTHPRSAAGRVPNSVRHRLHHFQHRHLESHHLHCRRPPFLSIVPRTQTSSSSFCLWS